MQRVAKLHLLVLFFASIALGVGSAAAQGPPKLKVGEPGFHLYNDYFDAAALAALDKLRSHVEDPSVSPPARNWLRTALGMLEGNGGGRTNNGARSMFLRGQMNAGMRKIEDALKKIEGAEKRDSHLDLAAVKSPIADVARAVANDAVEMAFSSIGSTYDLELVFEALDKIGEGDAMCSLGEYSAAAHCFCAAVKKIDEFLNWNADNLVIAPFHFDLEQYADPARAGWTVASNNLGNGVLQYETDPERGNVLLFRTDAFGSRSGRFINGDSAAEDFNPGGDPLRLSGRTVLGYWGRLWAGLHWLTWVYVRTVDEDLIERDRAIVYRTESLTDFIDSRGNVQVYLGTAMNDWKWHYIEYDLQADLQRLLPGERIKFVNGVHFFTSSLKADEMVLYPSGN